MKIVFVHGFLGSAMNWAPILSKIQATPGCENWELKAIEMLGHGRRGLGALPRPLTLDDVSADLARQMPTDECVAVGHSFGIRPLLRFAAEFPARVKTLIPEDSSPVLSGPGFEQLLSIFNDVRTPFETREQAKLELDRLFGVSTTMSKFLLSNIREIRDGVHDWRFQKDALYELLLTARNENLWREWESYPGPVHMILGGAGSYVPDSRLKECIERRPRKVTDAVRIQGAGHWVHSDQPAPFVAELVRIARSSMG